MATNKRRALTAKARVEGAIWSLEHLLEYNKTQERIGPDKKRVRLGRHAKWIINQALYDLRNAKTLLANSSYIDGDDSARVLKDKIRTKINKILDEDINQP